MLDLLITYACTCGAVGALAGALAAERVWWLLYGAYPRKRLPRPLPRPWRPVARAYRQLAADIWRLLATVELDGDWLRDRTCVGEPRHVLHVGRGDVPLAGVELGPVRYPVGQRRRERHQADVGQVVPDGRRQA